jgi:parallel beta-helix repeat protein
VRISGPTVITKPGCYYVTNNIFAAAGDIIVIRADDVSLDLKGHTLGLTASSDSVIRIDPGFTGISVFNGTLTGGSPAVTLQWTTGPKSRLHFRNLTVKGYRAAGFHLTGLDQLDIIECKVISVSDHGVMAFAGAGLGDGVFSGHFIGNTFRCSNSNILSLSGARGAIIRGNHLTGESDQFGIHVDGPANLIEGNTIASVHGTGIHVQGNGNLIANNTVNHAGISGIRVLSDDNRIAGNVVQGCREGGIRIGGSRNLIEGNHVCEQQAGAGLEFVAPGGNNAYRNNMLRGNPGGAVSDPFANTDAGGNIV